MPEYPECLISGLLIWWFLLLLLKNKLGDTLFVLDLWADATAPELASAKRGSPESLGVPYRLNDKCKLKRGQRMSQKPLYPPPFSNSGQHISSYGLKLQAVEWNSRNVILNLGNIWLQVCDVHSPPYVFFNFCKIPQAQLFTHTMAQIYTRAQWEESVCKVHRDVCPAPMLFI
jgi:hypothetical protein